MSAHIVDVTQANAQSLLIDESLKRPVLTVLWAQSCEICAQLMPVLEKLALEYAGQFLLAKVDVYAEQMLASQFGVQATPTVMLLKDGQPVNGFVDLKPEAEIRDFLSEYLPKPWELGLAKARELMAEKNYDEAVTLLRTAYEDSAQRGDIATQYAACLIKIKRVGEAEEILAGVKLVDQDQDFELVKAEIALAKEAQRSPELEALESKLSDNPDDLETIYQLAIQYSQQEYHKEALGFLYRLIQKDMNYASGDAKKAFLDILAVLGKGDPIAAEFQRKLYTLLY